MLLPDELIEKCAAHHAGNGPRFKEAKKEIVELLQERRKQCYESACQVESFQKFMQTAEAQKVKKAFARDLEKFHMTSKHRLVNQNTSKQLDKTFKQIRAQTAENGMLKREDFDAIVKQFYGQAWKPPGEALARLNENIDKIRAAGTDHERYAFAKKFIRETGKACSMDPVETGNICFANMLEAVLRDRTIAIIYHGRNPELHVHFESPKLGGSSDA